MSSHQHSSPILNVRISLPSLRKKRETSERRKPAQAFAGFDTLGTILAATIRLGRTYTCQNATLLVKTRHFSRRGRPRSTRTVIAWGNSEVLFEVVSEMRCVLVTQFRCDFLDCESVANQFNCPAHSHIPQPFMRATVHVLTEEPL